MLRKSLAVAGVLLLGLAAGLRPLGAAGQGQDRTSGPTTASAGQIIISEFREFGPGATNTLRDNNEFIEVYNATSLPHTVSASSGTGYGIAASDGVLRCTIPNGTVIPSHGHYLCVNSVGYALGTYPAGNGTTATGDATYAIDIPANAGIAVFNTNVGANFALGTRLDAVGSVLEANTLYKQGTGYPSVNGTFPIDHSFLRKTVGQCPDYICAGNPLSPAVYTSALVDTGNNANDFYFLDTNGTSAGAGQRLASPGPENLSGPIALPIGFGGAAQLRYEKTSGCSARDAGPNRVRDNTPDPGNNSSLGTIDLRTTWHNTSGGNITRLRFRVIDLTTFPAPSNVSDLRPRTSTSVAIAVDAYPCGSGTTNVTVQGTTLEQPPNQPNGGGFNSSMSADAVTLGAPLAPDARISVRFLIGIQQAGIARFCVIPETLPAVSGDPYCYIGNTENVVTPAGGDFDFDQKADLPMYNPLTGQWRIMTSSSGFASATSITWGGPGFRAVPGDYDGDGRIDPAVYNTSTGVWSILTSSSNYTRSFSLTYGGGTYEPEPADYDGDGMTDISVAGTGTTEGQWGFVPSSTNYSQSVVAYFSNPGSTPVAGQDFDGDHKADMVLYNEGIGRWTVITSSSGFTTTTTKSWGGPGYTLVPGDYDGDGRSDYGVYSRLTGVWSILKSSSGYTTALNVGLGGAGYVPVPGDFDGDGRLDVVVFQAATNKWFGLKSSTSYATSFTVTGTASGVPLSAAVVPDTTRAERGGDFDGDRFSDLTVYNTSSGVWSTLYSSTGYATATNVSWGGSGYVPAPGDYDGDGLADLAVYQQSTGQWLVLKSSTNFTTSYSFSAGGAGYIPVAADYDGDGRTDMVVYNTTTGLWFGLKSSSNFTTALSIGWGGTGYTAVPGDFDGDGKADLAVYQASSGNWLILTSSSNYATSVTRNFGGAGFVPVQADFDGDGITDFAVYQTSTGLWTLLESSSGNTIGFTIMYGGTGFTPVAGDWDGDGLADIGVYNVTTGGWSILLSSTSFTTSLSKNWGGAGYTPVQVF
jgi:hypothetical protein